MPASILIACECSQIERNAFAGVGLEAWSADLQPCYGGYPEWHYQGDMFDLVDAAGQMVKMQDGTIRYIPGWDAVIAHPPCTYLAQVGAATRVYGRDEKAEKYLALMKEAAAFFRRCLSIDAMFLAVENPRPCPLAGLPRHNFIVYPDRFGSRWAKRTHWWVRNLPPLLPMRAANPRRSSAASNRRGQKRSESFPEVAEAMAAQWGGIIKITHKINNNLL